MLRGLRRTRFASLFALLVLTGGIPISIAELLHDADDVICAPAYIFHDASAHKIGAAGTPTPPPEHCAVCHWLQSLNTVTHVAGIAAPTANCHHLALSEAWIPGAIDLGHLSARAPPTA
jgi:hypothetical protein